jgi:hypothetical protein
MFQVTARPKLFAIDPIVRELLHMVHAIEKCLQPLI